MKTAAARKFTAETPERMRTLWLGKLGHQTLWMLLNCSYGQPSI